MILPPTPDSSGPSSSSELPADYRNPWLSLGENLQAVAADTRLRLRELWRRNGDGSVWRPTWWPRDLAPLFWPLLLALLLSAAVGMGLGALKLLRAPMSPSPAATIIELPVQPPVLSPVEPVAEPAPTVAVPRLVTDGDQRFDLESPDREPELEEDSPGSASAPTEPPQDPLAELLQRPEAEGLLTEAAVLPDQATLVLQVSAAFRAQPFAAQQRLAERWQQWAMDLGYEHLELRDSHAGLLARDALVGSGMIVLHEPAGP